MRLNLSIMCLLTIILGSANSLAEDWRKRFETPFEKSDGWDTVDYQAAITDRKFDFTQPTRKIH